MRIKINKMGKYAGQKKVANDITRKVKSEKSKSKSNAKKRKLQSIQYYNKLINMNKLNNK